MKTIGTAFSSHIDELRQMGISNAQISATTKGLTLNKWRDAIDLFCQTRGHEFNFYLGPLRAMEGQPLRLGFLLLKRNDLYPAIAHQVEVHATEIGQRLFGKSCDFFGRHVEYYDVIKQSGPFADAAGEYIALFTPFYMSDEKLTADRLHLKRSILFHNIIQSRFKRLTLPFAAQYLRFDQQKPLFLTCNDRELSQAIILWLTLHELIHGSGPLPFFDRAVPKIYLGRHYAGIEEMRVDMTVWCALQQCQDIFGPLARLAQQIILAERLIRSPKPNFDSDKKISKTYSSDSENGVLWLSALNTHRSLEFTTDDCININMTKTMLTLNEILNDLYREEEIVAQKLPDVDIANDLLKVAQKIKLKYLKPLVTQQDFNNPLTTYMKKVFALPKKL